MAWENPTSRSCRRLRDTLQMLCFKFKQLQAGRGTFGRWDGRAPWRSSPPGLTPRNPSHNPAVFSRIKEELACICLLPICQTNSSVAYPA